MSSSQGKWERPVEEMVLYEKIEGGIAYITLNRPEKGNALVAPDGFYELAKKIDMAVADDDVKVIILRGNGPHFCTGDDLNVTPYEAFGGRRDFRPPQTLRLAAPRALGEGSVAKVMFCPKTIIAQVHGYAIGTGTMLVSACDLAVAAESAKLSHAEQRIGFAGLEPTTFLLTMLNIGPKRHREWLLSGQELTAKKALEWGLVNSVVPDDKIADEALRWAKAVAAHSADGLMIAKEYTNLCYEALGVHLASSASTLAHALFQNLKWRDNEFNFIKVRAAKGAREAFREREKIWGELGF